MGEIVFWGCATVISFVLSLLAIHRFDSWAAIIAGLFTTIIWCLNISMWWCSTIEWMLFTDTFFIVGSCVLYYMTREKWLRILIACFVIYAFLDIAHNKFDVSYGIFSNTSNAIYAVQLLLISHKGIAEVWRNRHRIASAIGDIAKGAKTRIERLIPSS